MSTKHGVHSPPATLCLAHSCCSAGIWKLHGVSVPQQIRLSQRGQDSSGHTLPWTMLDTYHTCFCDGVSCLRDQVSSRHRKRVRCWISLCSTSQGVVNERQLGAQQVGPGLELQALLCASFQASKAFAHFHCPPSINLPGLTSAGL